MVCPRCIEAVEDIFKNHFSEILSIDLGNIKINTLKGFNINELSKTLKIRGFEIIKSKEQIITEKVKIAIIKLVFYEKENEIYKNSVWLENELNIPYQKLCRIFSKNAKTTIEKYIILQKMEKVKELLNYNKLSLEEISKSLGYKNLSHLSSQFKRIENISLSKYKKENLNNRNSLDNITS